MTTPTDVYAHLQAIDGLAGEPAPAGEDPLAGPDTSPTSAMANVTELDAAVLEVNS